MNARVSSITPAAAAPRRGAVLLVLLYLSCSGLWYLSLPPLEAPDENAHYDYARYIATYQRLPATLPPPPWDPSQWIQPPLYYMVISPVLWMLGPEATWINTLQLNESRALFGLFRCFVFDGQVTTGIKALYSVRLLSLLFGLGTVLCSYAAMRRLLRSPRLGLLAASGLVLVPQFTFLSTAVSNDTLVTFLSAAAVAVLFRLIQGDGRTRTALACGLLAGLALATKANAACLLPMVVVGVGLKSRAVAARLRQLALLGAGVAAGSGWYFFRNWIVFGDVFAWALRARVLHPAEAAAQIHAWNEIAARPWYQPYFLTTFPAQVFTSFWGKFGWADLTVSWPLLLFYTGVSLVGVCGVVAFAARAVREPVSSAQERTIAWTCCTGVGAACVAFMAYNFVRLTPQARLLYPVLVPLLGLGALGARTIVRIARARVGTLPIRWVIACFYFAAIAAWFAAWRLAIVRLMTS